MNSNDMGIYFYGVARPDMAGDRLHSEGVQPGEPVELLVLNSVSLAISRASLGEFAPEKVEERLKAGETQWVEEKALVHAAVLEELMRRGTVVPMRFGILFRDRERLVSTVKAQEGELVALLNSLQGKLEWGVKVFCQKEVLKETLGKEDPETAAFKKRLAGLSPGMNYLQTKRLDLYLEKVIQKRLGQWSEQIHGALSGIAAGSEILESNIPGLRQADETETVFFHGAYLVGESDSRRLSEVLEGLGHEFSRWGCRFDLSGPWPPYHFVQWTPSVEKQ